MPIIDRKSLSITSKEDGIINVAAKLVGKPSIIIPPKKKLLDKEVAITIQELASKKVIGPEALVKVQLKGLKLERAGGVWPPYMVKLEKGIVINVEKSRKYDGRREERKRSYGKRESIKQVFRRGADQEFYERSIV